MAEPGEVGDRGRHPMGSRLIPTAPRTPVLLYGYSLAWKAALPILKSLAYLDTLSRRIWGCGILPVTWSLSSRLCGSPGPEDRLRSRTPCVWMHCASLGEAKGMWALAKGLPSEIPLVLTAATATGVRYLEKKARESKASGRSIGSGAIGVAFAPLDHPEVLGNFLETWNVRCLCLYELEIWPHALQLCSRRGVSAVLVSGRMSARGWAVYHRFPCTTAFLLDKLAWIQAQAEKDQERFSRLSSTPCESGVDFKVAAYLFSELKRQEVDFNADNHPKEAKENGLAFFCLHLAELRMFMPVLPALMQARRLMIFPRYSRELPGFASLLAPLGFHRYSSRAPGSQWPPHSHILVDVWGKVGELLPKCGACFVGGSLVPRGCHNLWEPWTAGARIFMGPHIHNQESLAQELMAAGDAEILNRAGDLLRVLLFKGRISPEEEERRFTMREAWRVRMANAQARVRMELERLLGPF